jgi:hypothetical protein
MRFEIQLNELQKEIWDFTLIQNTLFLDFYSFEERESTRKRKYLSIKRYDRIMNRQCTMKESEVMLTEEIKNKALTEYFKTIDCKKWSEK